MHLTTERFSFRNISWAISLILILILPLKIAAQSNQYCDTSKIIVSNVMYNDALILDSLKKPGAITLLKKAIKLDTAFAAAYFKLGEIYHNKAIAAQYDIQYQSHTDYYLRKASDNFISTIELCESTENYAAYFYLGEQFYMQQEYSLAGHYLELFLKNTSVKLPSFEKADTYYSNYLKWKGWKENPYNIKIYTVKNISTEKNEIYPFISSNGQYFYFNRQFDRQKINSIYMENAKEFYISYIEAIDSNQNWVFSKGTKMNVPFNQDIIFKEITANLQNSEMYLTLYRQKKINNKFIDIGDIYYTKNIEGYWDDPEKISDTINLVNIYTGQPCITNDGKKLFFVSNRPGGYGGTDIYYCIKDSAASWGDPINLGSQINTFNDERTPFIHYDNKTLYFTSNGHFGMGGFDVFVSKLDKEGNWSEPENLGIPINTTSNEQGMVLDARGIKGYFASKTLAGNGGWDIFCVDIPKEFRPDEMIILNGKIHDTDSLAISEFTVEVLNLNTYERFKVLSNIESGTFSAIIPKQNCTYYIKIEAEGYSFGNTIIDGTINSHTYFADIELTPIKKGSTFYLPQAYFDANAKIEFKTLGIFSDFAFYLKKQNQLKIKIIGINKANSTIENYETLSEKAHKLQQFLIQKGISNQRVSYKNDSIFTSNLPLHNPTNSEILIEVTDY